MVDTSAEPIDNLLKLIWLSMLTLFSRAIIVFLLALVSLVHNKYTNFYQDVSEELVVKGPIKFEASLSSDQAFQQLASGFQQGWLIENADNNLTEGINVLIPTSTGKKARARVLMSVEDVFPGVKKGQTARAILVPQGIDGQWLWSESRKIIGLIGTQPLEEYTFVAKVPDNAKNIRLSVQLAHATGNIFVKDVSVKIVEEKAWAALATQVLFAAWVCVAIWIVFPLLHFNAGRGLVVAGCCLLFFMLMPAEFKRETVGWSLGWLNFIAPSKELPDSLTLSKYGHFFCISFFLF